MVMKLACVPVLLAAALLAGCNADQLPPQLQYATFKGVVLDGATQKPVANATVTVDTVLSAPTAADGSFIVKNVPTPDIDYAVQAEGYKLYENRATVEPNGTVTVTVTLSH